MNKCKSAGSICALLLASLGGTPNAIHATESQRSASQAAESIAFMRSVYDWTNPRAPDFGTGLFRINPANRNVVQLTPLELNTYHRGGSWSPGGTSLVYEHARKDRPGRSQLFVTNRQGISHRITSGAAVHASAVWGPKARIAFITDFGDQLCLSTVKADGTRQHLLFCPNNATTLSTPQWSLDGKSIYVSVGRRTAKPSWISKIWRVDLATSMATRLFRFESYAGGLVAISPDGTRAIYTDTELGPEVPATLVDLTTGGTTTLPGVFHQARFSHDGRRIAFTRTETVDGTEYSFPYVMKADGTHQHRIIDAPTPGASYTVLAWSKDNTRILVDPNLDRQDENGGYAGARVWLIDAASHAITKLTRGQPNTTGWYEP